MAVWSSPGIPLSLRRSREIREYGWRERYVSARIGINSRLDPIQAAILGVKLESLAADNARRRTIADRYDSGLAGLPLTLPMRRPDATHVFHQYVIRLAERDALRDWLHAARIGTGIHYPVPVHLQPAYRGRLATGPSGLGVTERAARTDLKPADVPAALRGDDRPRDHPDPRLLQLAKPLPSPIGQCWLMRSTPLPISTRPAICGQPRGSFHRRCASRATIA